MLQVADKHWTTLCASAGDVGLLSLCSTAVACQVGDDSVVLWEHTDLTSNGVRVSPDGSTISALSMYEAEHANLQTSSLAVCTQDCVYVFMLGDLFTSGEHRGVSGEGILSGIGPARSCCLYERWGDLLLAVVAGANLLVYNFAARALISHHQVPAPLTVVIPGSLALVTCTTDRTLQLWTTDGRDIVYRSSVLSAFQLQHASFDTVRGRVLVGTHDGVILVLSELDLSVVEKVNIAKVVMSFRKRAGAELELCAAAVDILVVQVIEVPGPRSEGPDTLVIIAAVESLIVLSCATFHVVFELPWSYLVTENATCDADEPLVTRMSSAVVYWTECDSSLVIATTTEGAPDTVNVINLTLLPVAQDDNSTGLESYVTPPDDSEGISSKPVPSPVSGTLTRLSMVQVAEPRAGSLLARCLEDRQAGKQSNKRAPGLKKKKPERLSKNIIPHSATTFSRKVASSGYGANQPVMKMFSGAKQKKNRTTRSQEADGTRASISGEIIEYPISCGILCNMQKKNAVIDHSTNPSGAYTTCEFSPSGKVLAIGRTDGCVDLHRIPTSKYGNPALLSFHNRNVSSLSWSNDGSRLISSSDDHSAALWSPGRSAPLLTLSHVLRKPNARGNQGKAGSSNASSDNPSFGNPIVGASFYYADTFIALAHGANLSLYRYQLTDLSERDDLKRLGNPSKYKRILNNKFSSQSITSLACYNNILSPFLVLTGSNKTLSLYDVANESVALEFALETPRPPHAVVLPATSQFVSHSEDSHNLLLVAAIGDLILYDVRSSTPVSRFVQHYNRQYPVQSSWSPCLRYVTTGSEDRHYYTYDRRMGTVAAKVAFDPSPVAGGVAYNPRYPQLAVSSGTSADVHFFVEND